jgi:pimeloyl-ACP methyl ester carboxylesterase
VELTETMLAQTPADVIAEFYDTFMSHDKLEALGALKDVETLVLVGSKDVITPVAHSRTIAAALPDAQLVVVEGAGHMVQLEKAAMVKLHLRALVRRASRSAARAG